MPVKKGITFANANKNGTCIGQSHNEWMDMGRSQAEVLLLTSELQPAKKFVVHISFSFCFVL